jgi:hypothetical protein
MRKIISHFLIFLIKLQLIRGRDVDCDFDTNIEYGYTCVLKAIYDKNFTILNATPDQAEKVRSVDFPNSFVTEVPSQIFKLFGKLKHFKMENVGIQKIEQSSFDGALHVLRIDLDKNKIEGLEAELFVNVPRLDVLELSSNQIDYVEEAAFYRLRDLAVLSLSYNQIKEIQVDTFKDNRQLSLLYLQFNQLEFLPAEIFKHTPALKQLFLNNNKINALSSDTFKDLHHLNNIQLINNECTNSRTSYLVTLEKCDENYKKLKGVPSSMFKEPGNGTSKHIHIPNNWESDEDIYLDESDISRFDDGHIANKTARKIRLEIESINEDYHENANLKIFFLITFNMLVAVLCGVAVYWIKNMRKGSTWNVLDV